MSVVVKGMKMPKDFFRCPFAEVGTSISQTTCRAKNWNICSGVGIGGCPLVELPKHGRLIDADAIDTSYSDPEVIETLNTAPTVLEADE